MSFFKKLFGCKCKKCCKCVDKENCHCEEKVKCCEEKGEEVSNPTVNVNEEAQQ